MLSSLIRLNSGHVRGLQTAWTRTIRHLPRGSVVVHPDRPDDELLALNDETESNIDELGDLMNPSQHDRGHSHRQLTRGTNKNAEKLQAEFVKTKILEKKEKKFYNPKEPNLLTWAARMQMKHLNQEDPIYWTPEMLANSFPASKDVVIQILKNRRVPVNEAEIGKHDSRVYKNWLKLKEVSKMMEGTADLNDEEKMLVRCGKNVLHLLTHAAGNTSVPVPPTTFAFRTQEQIAEENKPVVKPVFSSILTSYEHDKGRLKNMSKVEETKPIGFDVNSVRLLLEGIANSTDAVNTHERDDSETDDVSMVKNSGHSQGHKADDVSVVPMFSDPTNRQKQKPINVSDQDVSMVRSSGHTNRHKADHVSVVSLFSDSNNRSKPKTVKVSDNDVSMVRDSGLPVRNQTDVSMLKKPTQQFRHNSNISKLQEQSDDDNQVRPLFSNNSKYPTNASRRKTSWPDEIKSRADSMEQARQPDDIKSRIINNFKSPANSSEQVITDVKSRIRTDFNSPADSSEHRNLDANHVEVMPLFRTEQQGGSNKGWKGRSNFEMGEKTERKSVVQQAGSKSDNYSNKYKR